VIGIGVDGRRIVLIAADGAEVQRRRDWLHK
jgi:hypothetical protein